MSLLAYQTKRFANQAPNPTNHIFEVNDNNLKPSILWLACLSPRSILRQFDTAASCIQSDHLNVFLFFSSLLVPKYQFAIPWNASHK